MPADESWPAVDVRRDTKLFVVAGLLVAVGGGLLLSPFASSAPDGLERVAADKGFLHSADGHALSDSPVANYSVKGVQDEKLSTGLAAVVGVLITFGFGVGLFATIRLRLRASDERGAPR